MSDSASCRILVVSSTPTLGLQFVQRVKDLTIPPSKAGEFEKPLPTSDEPSQIRADDDSSASVPWTIKNRYYTADVHFETRDVPRFRAQHAAGVPAIVYVWAQGEPCREHIPEIARKIADFAPEVSLAVRFARAEGVAPGVQPDEGDDGLDEFVSEHGFEFVDGERGRRIPSYDDRNSDDEDSGIPGLPRVVDALSTIMWPSLVQSDSTQKRKSRARELLGWALEEEGDDGLRALISDAPAADPAASPTLSTVQPDRTSRMRREMEELERWLSEGQSEIERRNDEDADADASAEWVRDAPVTSADGWADMLTPPSIQTPRADASGFDDDFADFVSGGPDTSMDGALLEVQYGATPLRGRLTPMHTGASFASAGSDFGDADTSGVYVNLDEDEGDDEELPSKAEIAETSRRIFGGADAEEADAAAFDLSRVLGVLQGMREEISGMPDEDARRRAAAKVALGLVYGLQADEEPAAAA